MRLLIACPYCNRQYDATKIGIGHKFRCHCGQILTVHEPKGHDAAVVCCAHCGALRTEGALKCEYCGADFTLHDRDLDTVCPHCFARVSRHARFCEFCGKPILPEMVAGSETKSICPACGSGHQLRSRAVGDISALECNCCGGLWLAEKSFCYLLEHINDDSRKVDWSSYSKARDAEIDIPDPDQTVRYRPCVVCGELMERQNFQSSGVIIDYCKDHGYWFDADELSRIVDWLRI